DRSARRWQAPRARSGERAAPARAPEVPCSSGDGDCSQVAEASASEGQPGGSRRLPALVGEPSAREDSARRDRPEAGRGTTGTRPRYFQLGEWRAKSKASLSGGRGVILIRCQG